MPNFGAGRMPRNRPPPPSRKRPHPKQDYQKCVQDFNNSKVGKIVNFGSALNAFKNAWEWFGFGGGKAVGVKVLDKAEESAAVTDYSVTIGGVEETAALTGSKLLGLAALLGTAVATTADLLSRQACRQAQSPEVLYSPLLSMGVD